MRKIGLVVSLVAVLVLAFGVAVVAADSSRNFTTHLKGEFELPAAVDTQAQGQASFRLSEDGDTLYYKLIVANIENVTMAHIHLINPANPSSGIGAPVVWLYPSAPPAQLIPGRFSGVLAEGTITDASLVNALAGGTLDDLLAAIESGQTYVNVHTLQFGGGEIRGDLH